VHDGCYCAFGVRQDLQVLVRVAKLRYPNRLGVQAVYLLWSMRFCDFYPSRSVARVRLARHSCEHALTPEDDMLI
jgi:hypothetical protein